MAARATTAKRLTAHPWAATKESKDETHEERKPGCGVWAIVRTIAGQRPAVALPEPSVPATPAARPCRSGTPRPLRARCGRDGPWRRPVREERSGSQRRSRRGRRPELRRARSPRGRRGPRRPRRRPRPRDPNRPTPSRRTGTTGRVGRPATTGRSRSGSTRWPTPLGSGGSTRWSTPVFTRCCTQPGEPLADGWITPDGSPSGMDDWTCRSPSKIQRAPKPMRRIRRAAGSGRDSAGADGKRGRSVGLQPPVLDGAEDVEADGAEGAEHENGDELMEERGMEAGDDQRVARLQRAPHARHRLATPFGRLEPVIRALQGETTAASRRPHFAPLRTGSHPSLLGQTKKVGRGAWSALAMRAAAESSARGMT